LAGEGMLMADGLSLGKDKYVGVPCDSLSQKRWRDVEES